MTLKLLRRILIILMVPVLLACSAQESSPPGAFDEQMNGLVTAGAQTQTAATQQADECEVYTSAFSFKTLKNMTIQVFRPSEHDIASYVTDEKCVASVTEATYLDHAEFTSMYNASILSCHFGENTLPQLFVGDVFVDCSTIERPNFVDPYETLSMTNTSLQIWEGNGNHTVTTNEGWQFPSGITVILLGHDDEFYQVTIDDVAYNIAIGSVSFSTP